MYVLFCKNNIQNIQNKQNKQNRTKMAKPERTLVGNVATVEVFPTFVRKTFTSKNEMHKGMYEAEVEGLKMCTKFGFTPELYSEDPVGRIITMSRVGEHDGLDWVNANDNRIKEVRQTTLKIAFMLRKHLLVLHENCICHGDVKLENLMFSFVNSSISNIYIIDFATSSFFNKDDPFNRKVMVCSDSFSSPESLSGLRRSSVRDDVWGFLACLFVWVSGGTPLFSRNDTWYYSFMDWYHHGHPQYWEMVVTHGILNSEACRIIMRWFNALRIQIWTKDPVVFPTEEEIEILFNT